jgi:hypothetical protein
MGKENKDKKFEVCQFFPFVVEIEAMFVGEYKGRRVKYEE